MKNKVMYKRMDKVKHIKLFVFFGLIMSVIICNHIFGWSAYLSDRGNLAFLTRISKEHLGAAALIYMALTIIGCVVLTLPGITFAILAGVLFGPALGTIFCSLATTLGAMAAFLTGRFFLKESIKPLVMKNRYLKRWLFSDSKNNYLFVLMLTRLVPLFPYNLQNFAYGITDIRFITYSVWSFLFMLPGTAMYTVGAAGLADRENRMLYLTIAVVLAVIVTGAGLFFKKKYVGESDKSINEKFV